MQRKDKLLYGFGGALVTLALLLLILPKAAHAAIATLVQVVNTSANPVPVFPAHTTYSSTQNVAPCGDVQCAISFDFVPTGMRLVVQNVSGYLYVNNTSFPPVAVLSTTNGKFGVPGTIGPLTDWGTNTAVLNANITAFVPQQVAPGLLITAHLAGGEVTLTGYLESCSITGCQ